MKSPVKQCDGLETFLDGRLKGEDRHRFENHLNGCDGCREAAETWAMIELVKRAELAKESEPIQEE